MDIHRQIEKYRLSSLFLGLKALRYIVPSRRSFPLYFEYFMPYRLLFSEYPLNRFSNTYYVKDDFYELYEIREEHEEELNDFSCY